MSGVDSANIVRVDLQEVFTECERQSAARSHAIDGGKTVDVIAIVEDDYDDIYTFFMEGAAKIADACNYVQSVDQDGLDALTRSQPNSVDDKSVLEAKEHEKFTGEAMDPDQKTLMIFDVPGLEGFYKNTIVQQYIKEALTHYILFKWYHIKAQFGFSREENQLYETALGICRFNSITNTKRKKVRRHYRYY